MSIIVKIKPDEKNPMKCGEDCPHVCKHVGKCSLWSKLITLNIETGEHTRCQPCLDAEAEYNALQNQIAERDEALRLSRKKIYTRWTVDELIAKAQDNLAEGEE